MSPRGAGKRRWDKKIPPPQKAGTRSRVRFGARERGSTPRPRPAPVPCLHASKLHAYAKCGMKLVLDGANPKLLSIPFRKVSHGLSLLLKVQYALEKASFSTKEYI